MVALYKETFLLILLARQSLTLEPWFEKKIIAFQQNFSQLPENTQCTLF